MPLRHDPDKLLALVPLDRTPSSLEAADAFRIVAEWHVKEGRLKEAAARFSSMARALATVDNSDLPSISFALLPVAATVAYSGDEGSYEELRQMAIRRFGTTANIVVAEQTLKTCLLRPADRQTREALAPLATLLEERFVADHGLIDKNPHYTSWVCLSLSLLNYRAGEYPKAHEWAEKCLSYAKNEARTAAILIVYAMIEQRSGEHGKALATLKKGQEPVREVFATKRWVPPQPGPAYWFDWIIASVLLTEAEQLIDSD